MAAPTDVIVIGAGIIGCSIAHQLAVRGARVRLFESRTVGAGATHASAGILAPFIEAPERSPLLDIAVRSLAMYDQFVSDVRQDAGVDVEYRICGTMELAFGASAAQQLTRSAEQLARSAGITAEWLDGEAARAREPLLAENVAGALSIREHGYVSASQLAEALTWAALRHGAEVETGRRIVSVRTRSGGVAVVAEDGVIWSADHVVIAAGSWVSQTGVDDAAAAAVRPIRGQLLRLGWEGPAPRYIVWGSDCYAVPWSDGSVLIGATVEDVGFDERATVAGVRDLLDAACEILPAAWRSTFQEARVGLRPATADGLPIIGASERLPGVVYATGHYRNGVLLAPITAALVCDLLLEDRRDPLLDAFGPERFKNV